MKHRLSILIIVSALALLPVSVMAEDTNALATLQKSFQKQEQALLDGYDTALGSMMAESKKNGDMDLYLVVEAERKRFETEKTIPTLAEVNISFKTPVEGYYKQRVGIFKKQVSALDALMKAEMKADRMESAKALKAEKDKVAFELADLESKLPEPATKGEKPSKDTTVSTTSKETKLLGRPDAQAFQGHHYEAVYDQLTWREAKKACEKMGGHLVIITSKAEEGFVQELAQGRTLWIGCTDEKKEGDWRWVDGSKMVYSDWETSQPDNHRGIQNYGINSNGNSRHWDDAESPCSGVIGYICEWDK